MSGINALDVSLDSLIKSSSAGKRKNSDFKRKTDQKGRQGAFKAARKPFTKSVVSAPLRMTIDNSSDSVVRGRGSSSFMNATSRTFTATGLGMRNQTVTPIPTVSAQPFIQSAILNRLGNNAVSGTSVMISNLNTDILPSDISELCVTIGSVKSVNFQFDAQGNSAGKAEVTFAKRSDAVSCVQKFNGVPLDGRPMEVKLSGDIPTIIPSVVTSNMMGQSMKMNMPSTNFMVQQSTSGPNVRAGLFGTALGYDGEVRERNNGGGGNRSAGTLFALYIIY